MATTSRIFFCYPKPNWFQWKHIDFTVTSSVTAGSIDSADWLLDWLIDWLVDWLIDWLRGYGGTPSSDQLLSQLIPVTGKVASKTILFSHYLGMGQFFFLVKHAYFEKRNWLVVYLPLWKMMEFVSWDSQYMGKMFQTTNQGCLILKSRPKVILQSLQFWPIPHFCVRRATPWSWPWSGRSRLRYTGSGNTRLWIQDGHICHMEWAVSPWTRGVKYVN